MSVILQLGDIIQIISPTDTDINEHMYHIVYIDENKLVLDEADGNNIILTLTDGQWDNEAIEDIVIISRAEEKGFARQNNLISGVWLDIYFNGDLPLTITGKITNLEKDKIEITTFPENDVIFIDFAYKGLPEDLQIEKIETRKAPNVALDKAARAEPGAIEPANIEPATTEHAEPSSTEELERRYKEIQRQLLEIPEDEIIDENLEFEKQKEIQEQTRTYIFNADQIKFGDDLEAITQMVDVPEEEQRFDIDKQLDDLLDDMLSTIPNAQRTEVVKNNIHKMIERFKQLRDKFSVFDQRGHALMPKSHGSNYKPLVDIMDKLEKQLYWLLPVVKTQKKIYTNEKNDEDEENTAEMGADDIELISFNEATTEEKNIVDRYEANTLGEGNKYMFLQRELNPYYTPFSEPTNKEDVVIQAPIHTNITALVDNLGDFNSSVDGNDTFTSPHSANKYERKRKVQRKRFALQNYNIGATGIEVTKVRGDNPIIRRKELTKNDRLDLKSIVTLPEPAVRFSRINLYTTTILDKANLNSNFLNYWQLLKDATRVKKTVISNIEKPYEHDADTFLKTVRNFMVDEIPLPLTNTNYSKFLQAITPKTKFLFNLIKPYLTGKLSINDILTYLEPFMIYHDDLTAAQYKDMNDYIIEKISDWRKKYASKAREYTGIKGSQNVFIPSLLKVFDENTNLRTKVLDVYGFADTIMTTTNADFIRRINEIDGGVFYNNAIALISTNLMIADGTRDMVDIDLYLNKEQNAAAAAAAATQGKTKKGKTAVDEGANIANDCNKLKTIAKRYIEIDELADDNGKEIYFDKKYDPTHYDIGEMFKADSMLQTSEQIQHYVGKLMKNKGMNDINARRDAEAILKGKRTIVDGEYAILETTSETSATIQYYVRQRETWVLDDSIDPETFADNMKMFCNTNEKCIAVKDKCEDQTTGANELKKQNLKLLLSEFNTTLNVNKDVINNTIEDALNGANTRIETLRNLRLLQMYKYETKKIEIANTLDEIQKIIVSPYDDFLNNILRQTDVAKRYLDISKFVKAFTREGMPENNESQYWLYCIKSNKKMLPTFISKLATTFLTGGNFGLMLDKICALQGTISDDGDKYVDKYSGYTIKMIEMSTDEEYNEEGFKIITRSVMEADIGDTILQSMKNVPVGADAPINPVKRKYATPDATSIYNVIEALSVNMGVNIEDQKDFIVRNVLKQLSNTSVMQSKDAYDKLFAKMAAKGKKVDTYEDSYNSILMYLTFAYYLIAIQTSVPPIKTKITFPGCKKSFSGFPIDVDTTNMKGLNYVACVAYKLRNKSALPWSAIANRKEEFIAREMEANITKFILTTEDVQNRIKTLTLHRTENPESTFIPEEHTIENWSSFLPPLKTIKMGTVQDVGDVFKSRLTDSLRKGSKVQEESIAELQSKMIMFSFHIIDLIEKTVHGEQALLKGKNGEPYVENACCEMDENNTIRYFVKKQPDIAIYNNKVIRLSDLYDDVQKLSKAVLLYDPSNTKRKLREIGNAFSEQTIYRAFIVYCKFNSLLPLGENLKAICPTKPENFDMNDTLEESIRKLKSNARNYSEHSLQQLLEIVNTSTKTPIKKEEKDVTNVNKLVEIMNKMDEDDKRPSAFRSAFLELLDTFEMNALSKDSAQMIRLKNLLPKLNADMKKQIIEFIETYGKNSKITNIGKFKACLETIMRFKETGNNLVLPEKDETGYKMINFMKKSMRVLTREIPNIVINTIPYEKVNIPAHWELSQIHQTDVKEIIKDHYSDLSIFYKDKQIRLLLEKMLETTSDVNDLAQNTLFYAPVALKTNASEKEEKYSVFDLDLTTLLFEFYFFSALMDLIAFQKDKEILSLPLKQLETEDEESFMTKANEMDILAGNESELGEKIASLVVVFTNLICKDKSVVDYSYKSLMELLLRSKEKEKEGITDYLKKMSDEEREVENLFKGNKLGRWSVGEQKGFRTYDTKTYDQEREDMENMAIKEVQLKKRNVVTDMNRDIFRLDMLAEETAEAAMDKEDNIITYMGEDAEPEDYGMDGDENFDY